MPSAVLIIASTRVHADPQEILRIQDTVAALREQGHAVDVLVPRIAPLLTATLDPTARVFTVPRVPFMDNPPQRPSFRRFITAVVMFFRGVALAAHRDYAVLHGFNDGALIARAIDRGTVRRYPYVAEIHRPFSTPGFFKDPKTACARHLERSSLRHASAIILPDVATFERFGEKIPKARVSLIPDPHAEITPDAFTFGEFCLAIEHIYDYVLRPLPEK